MVRIYSSSIITIAASSAEDGSAGLFAKRTPLSHLVEVPDPSDPDSFSRVVVALNNNKGYNKGYGDLKRLHEMYGEWSSPKDLLPLLRRAWTFQERLLSTRIVHFTPLELLFKCKEELNCQCSTKSRFHFYKTVFEHTKISSVAVTGTGGEEATHSETKTSPAEEWNALVEFYPSLQLTYQRDIFPALSGLAQEVSRKAEDVGVTLGPYCAGLWGNYLPTGLCWKTTPFTQKHDTYYAPSWSWASRRGIYYHSMLEADDRFQLVSLNAVGKGHNPLGELQEGSSIVVRANVVPAIKLGDLYEIGRTAIMGYVHWKLPSTTGVIDLKDTSSSEFAFDFSFKLGLYLTVDETDTERIFTDKMLDYYCIELLRFFPMLKRDASPVMEVQGILVQKVPIPPPPSEEAYRRIGMFYYRGPATIFGYSFDAEKYWSTFKKGGSSVKNLQRCKDA